LQDQSKTYFAHEDLVLGSGARSEDKPRPMVMDARGHPRHAYAAMVGVPALAF